MLDDGKSVSDQESEGREDCAELGWDVADVYTDNGRSASEFAKRDREEWSRLLADLEAGRGDALWLWEASRGDRKLTEWSQLLDYCHDHGILIRVASHDRTYDMANARDWETLAEEGIRSAAETKKISLRVRRGVAGGIRKGRPQGPVPYGYRREYDPETKRLVVQNPDPVTAPIVRRIVKEVGEARSLRSIVAALNAEGIPSPKGATWTAGTVRRIATAEVYVARRTHGGRVYPGTWPALVDDLAFAAAGRAMAERTVGGRPAAASRPGRQRYEWSGIAACAVCGAGLSVNPGGARRPHYWCSTGARHVSIMLVEFDAHLLTLTVRRLARPDILARLSRPDDSRAVAARRTVGELQARLSGFYKAAATGKLSPQGLAEVEAELLPQIAAAQVEADTVAVPLYVVRLVEGQPSESEIRARVEALPVTTRRTLYRLLFASVKVKPAGRRHGPAGTIDVTRLDVRWRQFRPTSPAATQPEQEEEDSTRTSAA
ncbi:recombinase family protein [Frankia sp. CNm7]|nr:recombinase family protein [Frankia nepalensis]